jgi:hypothetical protein
VKVSCSYGFAVNSAAGDALLPSLPVVLVPSVSLTVGDPAYETFVDQLAQAVAVWHKTNQPSTSGGSYVFSVSAFSNLSQGANNAMQPLLQVNDLKVAIQAD